MTFTDFGENFEVFDPNGEEPKDVFVSDITKVGLNLFTLVQKRSHIVCSVLSLVIHCF